MHRRRAQLTMTAVAIVLGVLVVLQIRAQSAGSELGNRSAQELTVLVANLNTRNDQLRGEVATLEAELAELQDAQSRGQTSLGQLQVDLTRVRAWAGLVPVGGPGVRITVRGSLAAQAVGDLLNELRNAGAEAIAIENVRVVPGTVVTGVPGSLSVENAALPNPFDIDAIGNSETLVGSLTRAGGIVAQLGATFPDAQLTVTPVDQIELPETTRDLQPADGTPRL